MEEGEHEAVSWIALNSQNKKTHQPQSSDIVFLNKEHKDYHENSPVPIPHHQTYRRYSHEFLHQSLSSCCNGLHQWEGSTYVLPHEEIIHH